MTEIIDHTTFRKGLEIGPKGVVDTAKQLLFFQSRLLHDITRAKNELTTEQQKTAKQLVKTFYGLVPKAVIYSGAAESFLNNASSDLSTKEKIGVALFAGLLGRIDDIVDNSFPNPSASQEKFEQSLRITEISLHGTKESMSVDEIERFIRSFFGEKKQAVFSQFVEKQLQAQWYMQQHPWKVGNYTYEDAVKYREETTAEYAITGRILASKHPEIQISEGNRGMLAQHLDDFSDVFKDGQKGIPNLFIGFAYNLKSTFPQEWEVLNSALHNGKVPLVRLYRLQKLMPNIMTAYQLKLERMLDQVETPFGKFFYINSIKQLTNTSANVTSSRHTMSRPKISKSPAIG